MSKQERIDRFLQPVEDIVIVHRSGSGTLLTPEKLDEGDVVVLQQEKTRTRSLPSWRNTKLD